MKRCIYFFILSLAFMACSKEKESHWLIDWTPIKMCIYVQNDDGQDLLNPQSESAIDIDNITIDYEGESFTVKKGYSLPNGIDTTTRTYAAYFDGITLEVNSDGVYYLSIGEWNGDDKRDYTTVTLHWGNGASDTFGFTSDYDYDPSLKNDPDRCWGYKFYRSGFLNGKVVDADNDPQLEFTIIR